MSRIDINRCSGPLLALIAAMLFGASTPLAKRLLGQGTDPWLLAGLLYCGAGLGLGIVRAFRDRKNVATLTRADWRWLLLVVLFGGVLAPLLLMFGLAHSTAASASLLLNVEGLATMLIAWWVFGEQADARLIVGALAILAGAALISYAGRATLSVGTLAVIGACICWGIDNNLTRKLSAGDPLQIVAVKGVAAGAINVLLATMNGVTWIGAMQVASALAIGFVGYGLSVVAFVVALQKLGTARTGAYFSTAPFIGAVLSILLLGESGSPALLVAAALMAIGVYLHLTEHHDHTHSHELLEHTHQHVHDEHHQHGHDAEVDEPHTHWHRHAPMTHHHPHYPDIHHRHGHS